MTPTDRSSFPAFDADALARACRATGLRRVVLYGSRATGEPPPGPDSDLDLAVSRAGEARLAFSDVHDAMSEVFSDHDVDLALLEDADPLFRWEIVDRGVLLFGNVLDFAELRAFAYRDFVDSADLRALERALFLKRMAYLRDVVGGAA